MAGVENAINNYIRAKDGNRPDLMAQAFVQDARLEMLVKTDTISFPGSANGLASITDILVSRFAADYENILTFCLKRPPPQQRKHFSNHWLVGMSAKSDGTVRVGCGRYDWSFGASDLVSKLTITIEEMSVLPAVTAPLVFGWLRGLPHPWCPNDVALASLPGRDDTLPIRTFLGIANP